MNLKKKLTPGGILTLSWGYIHVYDLYSETRNWYISQTSGERLQDHWSSGFENDLAPQNNWLSNILPYDRLAVIYQK